MWSGRITRRSITLLSPWKKVLSSKLIGFLFWHISPIILPIWYVNFFKWLNFLCWKNVNVFCLIIEWVFAVIIFTFFVFSIRWSTIVCETCNVYVTIGINKSILCCFQNIISCCLFLGFNTCIWRNNLIFCKAFLSCKKT